MELKMTDNIVTRLRGYDFMRDGNIPDVIMNEAADEIERLRQEINYLIERLNHHMEKNETLFADRDSWMESAIELYDYYYLQTGHSSCVSKFQKKLDTFYL